MKFLLKCIIYLYRLCLRPFVAGCCRFEPSCSEYALLALDEHGAMKGSKLICKRLLKCHPWHPGGHDPVPNKQHKETS